MRSEANFSEMRPYLLSHHGVADERAGACFSSALKFLSLPRYSGSAVGRASTPAAGLQTRSQPGKARSPAPAG